MLLLLKLLMTEVAGLKTHIQVNYLQFRIALTKMQVTKKPKSDREGI